MFVGIGLSFKGDSFVRKIAVFKFEKPVIILNNVENIKKNDQHFQLLP